jgi:hypothetical protein
LYPELSVAEGIVVGFDGISCEPVGVMTRAASAASAMKSAMCAQRFL